MFSHRRAALALGLLVCLALVAGTIPALAQCTDPVRVTGIDVGTPDDEGTFIANISWENASGGLEVYWRGGRYVAWLPGYGQAQNPFPMSLSASCMTSSAPLRAVATGCNGQTDESTISVAQPNDRPSISGLKVTNGTLRFTTDFPHTLSKRIVVEVLPTASGSGRVVWTSDEWSTAGNGPVPAHKVWEIEVGQKGIARLTATACQDPLKQDMKAVRLDGSNVTCKECLTQQVGCPNCVGDPIHTSSGNTRISDIDPIPAAPFLPLQRTHDSMSPAAGWFGLHWTSFLDAWLRVAPGNGTVPDWVTVGTEDNAQYAFERVGNSTYVQRVPDSPYHTATLSFDGLWTFIDSSRKIARVFDGNGRIYKYRQITSGREITILYDASGAPEHVADSWQNFQWDITVATSSPRRITSIAVAGHPELTLTYLYDVYGPYGLDTVNTTAGRWRAYGYHNYGYGFWSPVENVVDGGGHEIDYHTYSGTSGDVHRGFASYGPDGDVDRMDYDLPGRVEGETRTLVQWATGRVETHYTRVVAGVQRTVEIHGGCASCDAHDAVVAYDAFGNLRRAQDSSGYITEQSYDGAGAHLLSSMTALRPADCDPATAEDRCRRTPETLAAATLVPTSASRLTSFQYADLAWDDRPTRIATTSVLSPANERVEVLTYDAATGQTLTDSMTGWSGSPAAQQTRTTTTALYDGSEGAAFAPGGTFSAAWTTLPQPAGMRRSFDGPRTDVADVTRYVYYPISQSVPQRLRGRLAATQDALGHISHVDDYDLYGNATQTTDPNGVVTQSTYDVLGRLLTTTLLAAGGCDAVADPLCNTSITTVTRTYENGTGPLATQTRPNGGVTVYTYDSRGRSASVSRGPAANDLRERIRYSYDAATAKKSMERTFTVSGGVESETRRESFTYDALAQLTATVHADNTSVAYTYDAAGRLATVRDENHTAANTSYAYDPAGRLVTVTQTLGSGAAVTRYGYDNHGNLTAVTDPNGNVTGYTYDDFGQMIRQTSPVTGVTSYAFDAAGQLVSSTDANGATTVRSYDALGRVISSTATRGTASEATAWSYDSGAFAVGRCTSVAEPTGATGYVYSRSGQLLRETKTVDDATYVTSFGYDADGNRTRLVYPSGRLVESTFDFADRPLSTFSGATVYVSSATYLPFGPLRSLVYGNGTTKTMTFDARYRPLTNRLDGPGALASYGYTYDNAGNITAITDGVDATYSRTFGYDDLNRLVTANSGSSLWGNGFYSYDAMGNLLSLSLGTWRTGSFSYLGTLPKLASVTENGVSRSVTYDAAGNELAPGASAYTPRNHLAAADALSYAYDGRGVRIRTTPPVGPVVIHSVTAAPASPQQPGTTITWTVDASGGIAPLQYRVYRSRMEGGPYLLLCEYSASNTCSWTPGAGDVGKYSLHFDVRSAGSTASFDAITYVVDTVGTPPSISALTADKPSPQSTGATVTWTATATGGVAPLEYRFWRRPANGSWAVVQEYGSSNTYSWTPAASEIGTYEIMAYVRSSGSDAGTEDYRSTSMTIGAPIAIQSVTASPASPQQPGTAITWTVSASGGIAPLQYRAYRGRMEGGPYQLLCDYSASNTCSWTPGPNDVGKYSLHFDVRSAGSTADVEAIAYVVYTVGTPPSISALTADKPSPQSSGTTVTWTATASGGVAPLEYRFWRRPANGSWAVVQEYGSSNTYSWTPAASEIGTYEIMAYVRSSGSDAGTEDYRSTSMTIGAPITIQSVTASPASPQQPGTTITWTVSASGGIAPLQYRAYRGRMEGGPYQLLCDYSTSNTCSWTPGPNDVGKYSLHFDVRSAGSTASLDAIAYVVYTVGTPPSISAVTADKPSPQNSGTTITWTATATGGVAPLEYEFWRRPPNGSWSVEQTWGASNAYSWTPSASDVGTHEIMVYVRSSGSDAGTEDYKYASMRIDAAAAITSFSADKTSPQDYGNTITFTATGTGSVPPLQFRFERQDGGVWTVVQAYGNSSSYSWTPAAADVGEHAVRVSIRNAGSGSEFDDTATVAMTVSGGSGALGEGSGWRLARLLGRRSGRSAAPPVSLAVTARFTEGKATATEPRRYSLYTPELNLMAETEASTAATPAVAHEYIWFAGQPVAQVDVTPTSTTTSWTFTDHLGTPLLQTDASAAVVWRMEAEPYGTPYTFRTGAPRHQPLRLPGHEADPAAGDREYNIFRWYRAGWGRYTQADPLRTGFFLESRGNPPAFAQASGVRASRSMSKTLLPDWYSYTGNSPIGHTDRWGLLRDCDQEHIQCFNKCWNNCPPWPIKKGNKGHYQYCQTKCLAEYMECEAENEAEKLMDDAKKWFNKNPPALPPLLPIPPPAVPPLAPEPVIPGFVPIINPCLLNPSLCYGPGGPA